MVGTEPRSILQFDKSGTFIARHSSIHQAAKNTESYLRAVCDCVQGKRKSTNGFCFEYEDGEGKSEHDITPKKILHFDSFGNFVAEYDSINEAARKNLFSRANISKVVNGKRKHIHGQIFVSKNAVYPSKKSSRKSLPTDTTDKTDIQGLLSHYHIMI